KEVAAEAKERGVTFLDTPVSGSVPQAESSTLAIMVGGDADALARHRDVLEVLGSSVTHMGGNGAGLSMKLATNLIFAASLCGIAEGLALGAKAGLDPRRMVEVLRRGAVPKILDYKGMAMVDRDYSTTFPVRLMRKDLRLIVALAERLLSPVPLVSAARQVFVAADALGFGEADQNAIIEVYQRVGGGPGPSGEGWKNSLYS
ncbi:MAG: NAD(P)-dependent oxidoreductase, partial [Nitrospinota bacterium]